MVVEGSHAAVLMASSAIPFAKELCHSFCKGTLPQMLGDVGAGRHWRAVRQC
jgi:hypothetical protein